jgi:LTXXQ motif family protein
MRKYLLWSLFLFAAPISSAAAQRPDSGPARPDSLRQRIEERFAARVQKELGLTNEQTTKLRATSQQFGGRRRELHDRQRQLYDDLAAQLKPGVAAKQDSVAKLTDAMIELRLNAAQLARDEMRDVSKYLNPVQRARLFMMRDRLVHRMQEVREHRGMRGEDGGKRWKGRQRDMPEPHE